MAALVPDETLLFWFLTSYFFSKQNETSFIWDQCYHLADDDSPLVTSNGHLSLKLQGLDQPNKETCDQQLKLRWFHKSVTTEMLSFIFCFCGQLSIFMAAFWPLSSGSFPVPVVQRPQSWGRLENYAESHWKDHYGFNGSTPALRPFWLFCNW